MMPEQPTIESRQAWLATLLAQRDAMLEELAQVAGVVPTGRLARDPDAALPALAHFVDATDFTSATEDARVWLVNRLGLFVAYWFSSRHGGTLRVQSDPHQRFYRHIVLTGMRPPAPPEARLDPFAIAFDAATARPRITLAALLTVAERELLGGSGASEQ